jgi:hypothetical protein
MDILAALRQEEAKFEKGGSQIGLWVPHPSCFVEGCGFEFPSTLFKRLNLSLLLTYVQICGTLPCVISNNPH